MFTSNKKRLKYSHNLISGFFAVCLALLLFNLAGANPIITATNTDTLLIDADNSSDPTPGDTIEYTVVIQNSGDMDAINVQFSDTVDPNTIFVPASIDTTPIARNDSYAVTGNVRISVPAGSGVLANDNDPDGSGGITVSSSPVTTIQGGNLAVANDGSFTYDSPPGYTGSDSFTYTIDDGEGNQDTATVTFTVADMIWFIDNNYGGSPSNGRSVTPFNSLTAFEAVNGNGGSNPAAGQSVFLHTGNANYAGPLTLENQQILIGQGAGDTIANISGITFAAHSVLPTTGGSRPVIDTNGITLAQNNTLRGLNVGSTGSNSGVSGSSINNLTISEMGISGSGRAVNINGGSSVNITLDQVEVTSSSNGGFSLQTIASGTTNLSNVNITTTGGTGFLTNNTNTLNVTGSGNSVNSTGTAVNITSTTIGGSGVTFQSVASQTANKGIILNNTGTGDFTVTGTGTTDGSGGTIQNINDRGIEIINAQDISLSNMNLTNATLTQDVTAGTATCNTAEPQGHTNTGCNAPIYMQTVSNVSLTNLTINGSVQHGINGNLVTGLSITNTDMSNIGNNNLENGVHIINLLGTNTFNNFDVDGSQTRNVLIENTQGSSTINVTNSSYDNASEEDGFFVKGASAGGNNANINFTVTNSSFSHNHAVQLKAHAEESSTVTANFTNNSFDGQPLIVGNTGVGLAVRDRANLNFTVMGTLAGAPPTTSTQTFLPIRGQVVNVFASGGGTAVGTIQGNDIQGSDQAAGIRVVAEVTDVDGATPNVTLDPTITVNINNNDISGIKGSGLAGVHIEARDGNNSVNGVARVHATVNNNYVTSQAVADAAMQVYVSDITANHANTTCVNVTNNFASGVGGIFGDTDFYYGNPPGGGGTFGIGQMQGYSGSVAATWTANGNTDGGHFIVSEGTIGGGTCTTVARARQESVKQENEHLATKPATYPDHSESQIALDGNDDTDRNEKAILDATSQFIHDSNKDAKTVHVAKTVESPLADVDVNLGTLNPGQQVTITFQATIKDQPPIFTQVCNQGTVTADGSINIVTNDPDTGTPNDATCTAVTPPQDWGDLPDSYGTSSPSGASHITSGPYLGNCLDAELSGVPFADALSDDNAVGSPQIGNCTNPDDEDGVSFANANNWSNGNGRFDITVNNGDACLNAWLDFTDDAILLPTGDGDFDDSLVGSDEHIVANLPVSSSESQPIAVNFTLPDNAADSAMLYLRVRLTERDDGDACNGLDTYATGTASPAGHAFTGEVEDYQVSFTPTAVNLRQVSKIGSTVNFAFAVTILVLLTITTLFMINKILPIQKPGK